MRRLEVPLSGSIQKRPANDGGRLCVVRAGHHAGQRPRKETKDLMLSPQIQILSKHEFPPLSTETTDENKPIRLSYGLAWGWYWTPYGKAFFKEGHDDGWPNYTVCFDDDAKIGMLTS